MSVLPCVMRVMGEARRRWSKRLVCDRIDGGDCMKKKKNEYERGVPGFGGGGGMCEATCQFRCRSRCVVPW